MSEKEKWLRRLAVVKVFIAGAILSLIIVGSYGGSYAVVKQGQCMVQHDAVMSALKEHHASGGQMPQNLSELASLEYTSGVQRHSLSPIIDFQENQCDFKYYPDGWYKPGRIFLQSLVCGSHVVTFGDGSRAAVSYWHYKPEEKQPDEVNLRSEEYYLRGGGFLTTLPVLVLFILLVVLFFIIAIAERIIKHRGTSP